MADLEDDYTIAPAHGPRVYARITAGEIACPRCGAVYTFGRGRRLLTPKTPYNQHTGVFVCPAAIADGVRCGFRAYLGVVVWPLHHDGARTGLEDHRPGIREALEIRAALSYQAEGNPPGEPRGRRGNQVCLCGVVCPVHNRPR